MLNIAVARDSAGHGLFTTLTHAFIEGKKQWLRYKLKNIRLTLR